MQQELKKLLNKICTELGFCLPPIEIERIINQKNITAEQFSFLVLKAEGMNPESELEWQRKIKNKFIEVFGNEAP